MAVQDTCRSSKTAKLSTAHLASAAQRAICINLSYIQHAVIPGHVGVVPGYPGQLAAIRAQPGGCHKVMTTSKHRSLSTVQICITSKDLILIDCAVQERKTGLTWE